MATTGIDSSSLALSGLASGFDWQSFISQMVAAERAPENTLRVKQSQIQQQNSAWTNIKTQLTSLQTQLKALQDASLFGSRSVQTSDSTIATATAASGAAAGTHTFNFIRLATASSLTAASDIASTLNPTADVSALTLQSANLATPVSAGTFTVNGHQITVAATDTLQQVFDNIATQTNNQVAAAYDPNTDKITLTSSSPIVLGSATDTSNFLQVTHLNNNGSGAIASSLALGSIRSSGTLATAGFKTPVTDGGSGAGEFKVNGVSINYNASTDTVSSVLDRLNNSAAGVTASYDSLHDRFILTSKATGDIGIALQDVTGTFLAATGLSAAPLARGKDLLYTIDGGDQLSSQSNTISDSSSGLTGLAVTALKDNSPVTISVTANTDKARIALQNLVNTYNQVQSYLSSQSASSTDSKGTVTAGVLANDRNADDLAATLRNAVFSSPSGLTGSIVRLSELGYQTNGYDNQLALSDSDQLDSALADHLADVKSFFTDATNGLAVKFNTLLEHTIGDDGSLVAHQTSLTKKSTDIDTQIAIMEKTIGVDQKRMTTEFIAMETAEQRINQQLAYLTKNFS